MEITKQLNFKNLFIFLFFALFPLGQIIRIGVIQPLDVVVGAGALYAIIKKLPKPELFKYLQNFLIIAVFSWIFGAVIFRQIEIFYGLLYLLRLSAYFYFLIYVWNFAKGKANKKLLLNCLLVVSVASAVLGWIQFFWIPDIKPFFVWGWDEHLFRLVGTFLDPTFLGLIIVFGLIISILKHNTFLSIFLLISLAFTYSRASYLAFFAGLLILGYLGGKLKKFLVLILAFLALILILPTSKNHVLGFARSFSALARVTNYQNTLKIFEKSPLFGIGYDNLCIAHQKYIGPQSFSSHACSGSDSSLLFILVTTGIAGLFSFVFLMNKAWSGSSIVFKVTATSLMVHSFFSNSMFYPWILGWMLILLAVGDG